MPRRICAVSGSRADYGLLYWVLKGIEADDALELQLAVTGMHLSPEFGLTVRQIEQDGFKIDAKVEMLLSSDSPAAVTKSMGLGIIGFADALSRLQPDLMLLLGDRFEIFAAAQAGMIARIPVAHIHGGELSRGAFDDAIRHSLTKLSHLHFVAGNEFAERVIQLGEQPDHVHVVGAPGLDHLRRSHLLSRSELEAALEIELEEPLFLVTYHPVTLESTDPSVGFGELLAALEKVKEATIILTKTNADTNGRVINLMIDEFVTNNSWRAKAFTSLGQQRYLSLLRLVDAVMGNSSSGIVEAPAVGAATVNIGDRQGGRLRATSVVDCAEDRLEIEAAIRKVLRPEFRKGLGTTVSLYGDGTAAGQIVEHLRQVELDGLLKKDFHDLRRSQEKG